MKIIFFQPIVSHYRESLIESILELLPDSHFYGAKHYLTNKPLNNFENNVHNELIPFQFKLFGHRFYYFSGGLKILIKNLKNKIVITGFDPHMLHLIVYLLVIKCSNKGFYWWSHANYGDQGRIGIFIRKFFYNLSEKIIVYSNEGKKRLENIGINQNKIIVANNCLNFSDYGYLNYSKEIILSKKNNQLKLIITGKLNKEKRIDVLLHAVKHLKSLNIEAKCTIIGNGTEYSNLKKITNELKIENNILFTGELFGEKVHPYLMEADIFIIPGAVGLSILHAFSFGVPVICTDNMEVHRPEIVLLDAGRNGDFYHSFDHVHLAQKIIEWDFKMKQEVDAIFDNCIAAIKKHEYLPHSVASNIYNSLK